MKFKVGNKVLTNFPFYGMRRKGTIIGISNNPEYPYIVDFGNLSHVYNNYEIELDEDATFNNKFEELLNGT